MYYHRIATRLLQQHHPICPSARNFSSRAIGQEEVVRNDFVSSGMLVSQSVQQSSAGVTNSVQLHNPRRPAHRLRNQRIRRRERRSHWCVLVACLLLAY